MSSELREYARPFHPTPPEDDPRVRAAHKRAEEKQGLYIHLTIYALVNLALLVINLITHSQGGGWWCYWPLLGWGIAIVIHVATVYIRFFSEDWKERETQRILARERRKPA